MSTVTKPMFLDETGVRMAVALDTIANYFGSIEADNYLFYALQNTAPTDTKLVWFDNTNARVVVAKYFDGTKWVPFGDYAIKYYFGNSAPSSTSMLWFDNTNPSNILLKYYTGSAWATYDIKHDNYVAQASAPSDHSVLWFDTSTALPQLKYYYNSSWQTFDLNKPAYVVSATAPATTSVLWFDSSGTELVPKVYNGSQWVAYGVNQINPIMAVVANAAATGVKEIEVTDLNGTTTTVCYVPYADASTGKINEAILPEAVYPKLLIKQNKDAMHGIIADDVHLGDFVKVISENSIYIVIDKAHLDTDAGYQKIIIDEANKAAKDGNGNDIDETYLHSIVWDNTTGAVLLGKDYDGNSLSRIDLATKVLPLAGGTLTGNLNFDNSDQSSISRMVWEDGDTGLNRYLQVNCSSGDPINDYYRFYSADDQGESSLLVQIGDVANKDTSDPDVTKGMGSITTNNVKANTINANSVTATNLAGTLAFSNVSMTTGNKARFMETLEKTYNTVITREGVQFPLPTLTYFTYDDDVTAHNVTSFVPLNSDGYIDPAYIPASAMSATHFIDNAAVLADPTFDKTDWKNGDIAFAMAGSGIPGEPTNSKMYYVVDVTKLASAQYLLGIREFTVGMSSQAMADGINQTIHSTYLKDIGIADDASATTMTLYNGWGSSIKSFNLRNYLLSNRGGTVSGILNLTKNTNISDGVYDTSALMVGGASTAGHISMDSCRIQSALDNDSVNELWLNPFGGNVNIGAHAHEINATITGNLTVTGTITNGSIAAATAAALTTTTAGSATNPVYFAGGVPVQCGSSLAVSVTGNAGTATKFAASKTINGTAFDGSANITTANWGTARTISIASAAGTTGTSINGSANASLVIPKTLTDFTSITSTKFIGALQGNADTASKLTPGRAINGTTFDGSADITTAKWGTARNITIGSTAKSVDGSAAVTWTLAEIGAAASSHTHSYLPLSGGTETGNITFTSDAAIGLYWTKNSFNGKFRIIPSFDTSTLANSTLQLQTSTDGGTTYNNKLTINISSGDAVYAGNVTATSFIGTLSGNATTATTASKLGTNAGSTSRPVYFSNGIPVQCDTTLEVSVTGSSTSCTGNAASASKLTNTTAIGSATLPVYFNASGVPVAINTTGVGISITGSSASCTGNAATASSAAACTGNSATATTATNANNVKVTSTTTSKIYLLGATATSGNLPVYCNSSVYASGSVMQGAAWNDYAEYRKAETMEPGRCIKEDKSGEMKLTTQRLEKGCEIISDTFGFAIGQTDTEQTPIACSGRALAYTDKPVEEFELGMPVCSGPNGTVSQMTEEEARMYPWCIIGTVSEIPTYEEWGAESVKVNGRIWIRIR